jgi:diguanylate cyclase (GGDEF)-like protein/PAS domain S-box-containing protein
MGTAKRPHTRAGAGPAPAPAELPYRALVDGVTDCAMYMLDLDGVVRSWNAGAELIHGFAASEVVGQHFSVFYTPAESARGYPARALETAERLGRFEDEGWRVRKDGLRFWARVAVTVLRDDDGAVIGFGKMVRDLTQDKNRDEALRRSEARSLELGEQAMRDPLTGAFNRRHLLGYLRSAVGRADPLTASILAIDVDGFKQVNDVSGHEAGDAVLLVVARLAQKLSREGDRLFRLGGDEFLMYLPGVTREAAVSVAERLRAAVEHEPGQAPTTISIGVAQLQPEDSVETWLHCADARLYEAKRAGRNRVA